MKIAFSNPINLAVLLYINNLPENITHLSLSHLNLTYLPKSIGKFIHLEMLYIAMNHLNELPKSIANLINLKHLNAHYNNLTKLPENIDNLMNLEALDLWHNNLTELPGSIGKLKKLRELDAHMNQNLRRLPIKMLKLLDLSYIDFTETALPPSFKTIFKEPEEIQKFKVALSHYLKKELSDLPELAEDDKY